MYTVKEDTISSNKTFCACGCGKQLELLDRWGRPRKFIHGHNSHTDNPFSHIRFYGKDHWNWKGENNEYISNNGYVMVRCINHPKAHRGYVLKHRLVMEQYLGRYLDYNEDVHHINGNRKDNTIKNLELMDKGEHTKLEVDRRMKSRGFNRPRVPNCLAMAERLVGDTEAI